MRKRHETERRKATERRAKAAAAPSIVGEVGGASGRAGEGERGGGGEGGAPCQKDLVWVWPSSS